MMVSLATFTENNSPGEYAPWIGMTTTRWEGVHRKQPGQLIEPSTFIIIIDGPIANASENSTIHSQLRVFQGTATGAVNTSRLSICFISLSEITYSEKATETHVRYGHNHFGLPFGNLGYPEVQFRYQPVVSPESPWISTPIIQEEEETIYADTNQSLTFKDLVNVLDRISHPTEVEEIPLPFDPDDYPVV